MWLAGQLEHPEWHGFKFYDLIFPLFLFLAGVSMPLSFAKRCISRRHQGPNHTARDRPRARARPLGNDLQRPLEF